MAQTTFSSGIRELVLRHAACEGTVLGTKEMESMKKLTTKDVLQHYFQVGDQFTIPGQELLEEFSTFDKLPLNAASARFPISI